MAAERSGFEADVEIGKGMKTIDRKGTLSLGDGHLTLRTSKGDVIAEGPINSISADKAKLTGGSAARIWIEGEAYTVGPRRVRINNPGALSSPEAARLGRDITRLKSGREITQQFLAVLEAEGGRIGKPDS